MCTERYRSRSEWIQLITECRASGLSDAAWCRLNGISNRTFYNACRRLRDAAVTLPPRERAGTINLTAMNKQEVVRLEIVAEDTLPDERTSVTCEPEHILSCPQHMSPHLDNHHTMEILLNGAHIRITNDANPALLSKAISSLRSILC